MEKILLAVPCGCAFCLGGASEMRFFFFWPPFKTTTKRVPLKKTINMLICRGRAFSFLLVCFALNVGGCGGVASQLPARTSGSTSNPNHLLWMDELLHHLRRPGMMIPP